VTGVLPHRQKTREGGRAASHRPRCPKSAKHNQRGQFATRRRLTTVESAPHILETLHPHLSKEVRSCGAEGLRRSPNGKSAIPKRSYRFKLTSRVSTAATPDEDPGEVQRLRDRKAGSQAKLAAARRRPVLGLDCAGSNNPGPCSVRATRTANVPENSGGGPDTGHHGARRWGQEAKGRGGKIAQEKDLMCSAIYSGKRGDAEADPLGTTTRSAGKSSGAGARHHRRQRGGLKGSPK